MDYGRLISEIKRYYPNYYRRHYKQYVAEGSFSRRMNLAEGLAHEVNDFFVEDVQLPYEVTNAVDTRQDGNRPLQLPPIKSVRAIELMTDYALANYHERGLSLKREANDFSQANEEYPPLGEGAREYHQREWVAGVPLSIGDRRKAKVCEICKCKFIDVSRAKNAKVCGQTCRDRKDALRQRIKYNESELGLQNEKRLKRYRVRQDFEYPFYSPMEMHELSARSEQVYEDKKIDRKAFKHLEEYDEFKLHGKRKPKWTGDKFGELSDKAFSYRPTSRDRFKSHEERNSPVIVRKIGQGVTQEQLEAEKWVNANKMKGLGVLIPSKNEDIRGYTSETFAI